MRQSKQQAYTERFAKIFCTEKAFAFWKGRVALYAILKGLGVSEGDEVILPGYTCVVNITPVQYLKAKPVYVDIEPHTYNINTDLLEGSISPRTRVIIAQHTYGYPADMDAILDVASRKGIAVVEDCCLALGSTYKEKLVGTFGKAAYFSSQWNKPYTTGLGGVAVCSDGELASRIEAICEQECLAVPRSRSFLLMAELMVYRAAIYPRTTALAERVFRYLYTRGLLVGSTTSEELREPVIPDDFFMGMSSAQARSGLRQLGRLEWNISHRRKMAELYATLLRQRGWDLPHAPRYCNPVLVRYPVRVADKSKALESASRRGVELGNWFVSPLHNVTEGVERYGYRWGMCPAGERASRDVVNLPLHPRASERTARRTVDFICEFQQAR